MRHHETGISVHILSTLTYITTLRGKFPIAKLPNALPELMMYDARQVANWFVTRAQREGRRLSIMSLLKLTYIAHGWHLETQNAPLFPNRIEAWQYGPVIPDVYREFRSQGVEVHNTANSIPQCAFDPADEELLNDVWSIYGHLPAFRLSDMTHVKGGPWDVTTMLKGTNYAEIPNELIRQHYAELRQRAEDATR